MPTSSPTGKPTKRPRRGFYFEYRKGRKNPYLVRWRDGNEKQCESFPTIEARNLFADALKAKRKTHGKMVRVVSEDQRATWEEFSKITNNAPILEVARFWASEKAKGQGALLEVARKRYDEIVAKRGLSEDSARHHKKHMDRLVQDFAGRAVGTITMEELSAWVHNLGDIKTLEPFAPMTRLHYRKTTMRFFDWLLAVGEVARNPVALVPIPDTTPTEEITVLKLEQAKKLFEVNRSALCIGRLALEAFAGVRFTTAARMDYDEIKFKEKGIEMPARKHKSAQRQFVVGLPDNLWAWLAHAPKEGFALTARAYALEKRAMFEAAGLKKIKPEQDIDDEAMRNILRHSFASYHVALHGDTKKTATILTHRSISTLYTNYKGKATEEDAKAYFEIVP